MANRIAPHLQAWAVGTDNLKARRELRALIAVVKAAEAHILELAGTDDLDNVQPPTDPLLKAVRAARASRGRGRGR